MTKSQKSAGVGFLLEPDDGSAVLLVVEEFGTTVLLDFIQRGVFAGEDVVDSTFTGDVLYLTT